MERVFIRRKPVEGREQNLRQINIGVTGLGRSVGNTFIAASLAFYFASLGNYLTFVQCLTPSRCNGLLYDAVAMDQRFSGRKFHDIYRLIFEKEKIRGLTNIEQHINWILPCPWSYENGADLSEDQRARLVAGARGDICIFDFSAEPEWDTFLMDMDRIVVVTDPLPSKLIRHSGRFQMLKKLELSGISTCWMVNRAGGGISRRQITGYLRNPRPVWVPEFDSALFYANEFACQFPWENDEIRCKMMEIFTKVSQ